MTDITKTIQQVICYIDIVWLVAACWTQWIAEEVQFLLDNIHWRLNRESAEPEEHNQGCRARYLLPHSQQGQGQPRQPGRQTAGYLQRETASIVGTAWSCSWYGSGLYVMYPPGVVVCDVSTRGCMWCILQGLYVMYPPGVVCDVSSSGCMWCILQGLYVMYPPGVVCDVSTRGCMWCIHQGFNMWCILQGLYVMYPPGPKTIKKKANSTPNKSQTQRLVLTWVFAKNRRL